MRDPFDPVQQLLHELVLLVESPRLQPEDWDPVIDVLEQMHEEYFEQERSPEGSQWQPLSKYTVARKGHDTILQEERLLIESVRNSAAPHAIRRREPDSLEFGTDRPFAGVHQEGSGRVPARPFLGVTEETADDVVEAVADAVMSMLDRAIPRSV